MNTKRILSLAISVVLLIGVVLSFSSCKAVDTVKGWFGLGGCEHTFSADWSTDATNHWHAATCEHTEEKSELAAHADANADGKCDVCAYAMSTGNGGSKPGNNNNKPVTPAGPSSVVYTITVVNAEGAPVEGVLVKIVDKENSAYGDSTPATATDAEGKVSFDVAPKQGWFAQIVSAPEGYASETENKQVAGADTEDTADDVYVPGFFRQYEFDGNNAVTITLVTVEAAPAVPEDGE